MTHPHLEGLIPELPPLPFSPFLFTCWTSPEAKTTQTLYTAEQMREYAQAALAALPGGGVARFARGIAHDWHGGGRTGIYFDGDFDVELMRSYYLIPTPNPHEADRNG